MEQLKTAFLNHDTNKTTVLLMDLQQRIPADLFFAYHKASESKKLPNTLEILLAQKKIWIKKFLERIHSTKLFTLPALPPVAYPLKKNISLDPFAETEKLLEKERKREKTVITLPEEKTNEFENIFGATTEDEKDILDVILQSTQKESEAQGNTSDTKLSSLSDGKFLLEEEETEETVEYVNPFLPYLNVVSKIMIASILCLLFSWGFFYIQLDEANPILSVLEQDNLYVQHQNLQNQLQEFEKEKKTMETQLTKLSQGAADIPTKISIQEIQTQKIDWLDLREQLHKATLDAFPYNDVLHYIMYTSFQGDAEKGTVSISGTITEPSGRVFLLTTKLVKSLNSHASFSGAEIKTFSKSKNANEEIGGFTSSFALTLQYHAYEDSATKEVVSTPKI
jgi:hypothetical protein